MWAALQGLREAVKVADVAAVKDIGMGWCFTFVSLKLLILFRTVFSLIAVFNGYFLSLALHVCLYDELLNSYLHFMINVFLGLLGYFKSCLSSGSKVFKVVLTTIIVVGT